MYSLSGNLKIEFNSSWGVTDPSPGFSAADINVRMIDKVIKKNGEYIPVKTYWIPGSTLKGSLRAVAISLSGGDCINCGDCFVCNIFGTGGKKDIENSSKKGKIRLNSSYIGNIENDTFIQSHIRINRKSGSVDDNALFFVEKMTPHKFSIHIIANDLVEDEFRFFKQILSIWGDYGMGRKHTMFSVSDIDKLKSSEYEGL